MKSIVSAVRSFHSDESGAAFIEYTVLLGVILAVAIAILSAIGLKANNIWSKLNNALPT